MKKEKKGTERFLNTDDDSFKNRPTAETGKDRTLKDNTKKKEILRRERELKKRGWEKAERGLCVTGNAYPFHSSMTHGNVTVF